MKKIISLSMLFIGGSINANDMLINSKLDTIISKLDRLDPLLSVLKDNSTEPQGNSRITIVPPSTNETASMNLMPMNADGTSMAPQYDPMMSMQTPESTTPTFEQSNTLMPDQTVQSVTPPVNQPVPVPFVDINPSVNPPVETQPEITSYQQPEQTPDYQVAPVDETQAQVDQTQPEVEQVVDQTQIDQTQIDQTQIDQTQQPIAAQ